MAITQEQLDAWEAQHGRIAYVPGPMKPAKEGEEPTREWEVVFRKPKGAEFDMYTKNALNPATSFQAQKIFARQLVISHELVAFDKLLEEFPGIPFAADKAIKLLSGMQADETAK